jgi:hypothetical protein
MSDFSPREIVSELDRFIVGQADAKRAVAIALRNRWRRLQLEDRLREEVLPKNILMIGPTGVGKTEISRRLAKLAGAPFLKVEATKFTEVGYVGRDVEQIIRDLVEIAITLTRDKKRKDVQARAQQAAESRVLDALVGAGASASTKEAFRRKLRTGELSLAPFRSAIFSASLAAGAPRRAAFRCTIPTKSSSTKNPTSCSTPSSSRRRPSRRSRITASFFSTRSTRSARATAASAATSPVRACSAICCR